MKSRSNRVVDQVRAANADDLVVAMRPAWKNSRVNPYSAMLADSLRAQSVQVREFAWTMACLRQSDLIHIHWPNEFFARATIFGLLKNWTKILVLVGYRHVLKGRIVWTVHNLWPHDLEPSERRSDASLLRSFLYNVDGLIFLSQSSKKLAFDALPLPADVPTAVIAHGEYGPVAGVPPRLVERPTNAKRRIGTFGQIRRYKNVPGLIRAVLDAADERVELEIAGTCADADLRREIETLARASSRIKLNLRLLDQAELEATVDRCDAIALPYSDFLNSGAALFALSRWRPVILPANSGAVELRATVGENWIYLYQNPFSAETLRAFTRWYDAHPPRRPPDLSHHAWELISQQTRRFYRRVHPGLKDL
jgi:beta-1,4-mannosyltransferase